MKVRCNKQLAESSPRPEQSCVRVCGVLQPASGRQELPLQTARFCEGSDRESQEF